MKGGGAIRGVRDLDIILDEEEDIDQEGDQLESEAKKKI